MGRLEEAIRILASELQSADGRRRIEEMLSEPESKRKARTKPARRVSARKK